jgi:hypothetical protein
MPLTKINFNQIKGSYVNATDFGLIDSSGSYTPAANKAALQAAIDSLGTQGGTVFVPAASYFVDPGITIGETQLGVRILGSGSGVGYGDNRLRTEFVTGKGTGSSTQAFITITGATNSSYARLSNFSIISIAGDPIAYGVVVNGGTIWVDGVYVSYCKEFGIWLDYLCNSVHLDHVTVVNTGVSGGSGYGLFVGSGGTSVTANTPMHVSNSAFRGNTIGVYVSQSIGFNFTNTVFESNRSHGCLLYKVHEAGAVALPTTMGKFDSCYFEANDSSSIGSANLQIDAGTRSYSQTDTPTNIVFNSCIFIAYYISAHTPKININIVCGQRIIFNDCNFDNGGTSYDPTDGTLISLGTYTTLCRFTNYSGSPVTFTDNGGNGTIALGNSIVINNYCLEAQGITVSLRDTNASGAVVGTGTAYYSVHGNVINIDLPTLTGTSGSTAKFITGLPSTLAPPNVKQFPCIGVDNTSSAFSGFMQLTSGAFTLSKDGSGTEFTASGTIIVRGQSISYTFA